MKAKAKVAPSKKPRNTEDADKPRAPIDQTFLYVEARKRWINVDPDFIPEHVLKGD